MTFIFWENFHKQDVLTASGPPFQPSDAQRWCCSCYNFAIEQQSKATKYQRRIDWSYCAECMNCTSCTQRIQSDLTNTEDTSWNNDQCYGQNGIYHGPSNENDASVCHTELLSDTSLEIFYKNYHAYGIGAMVIVGEKFSKALTQLVCTICCSKFICYALITHHAGLF